MEYQNDVANPTTSPTPILVDTQWQCHGGQCLLGEGLWFDAVRQRLFYTDIYSKQLYCKELLSNQLHVLAMPDLCCWLVGLSDGHYWLGIGRDLYQLNADSFVLHKGPELEANPGNRLNDAGVDPTGRLWFGSMDRLEMQPDGQLYRLDISPVGHSQAQLTVQPMDRQFVVSNGPVFSRCGQFLYHANSALGRVERYRFTRDGGLTDRQVFVQFSSADGYPDGMTLDVDGGLWVAHWQGAAVSRFDERGVCTHKYPLPVSQVTNLVFAGADFSRLFVTTACVGLSDAQRAAEPLAGALFELRTPFCGLAATPVQL